MTKRHIVAPIDNLDDKALLNLGAPLGFNLIVDFSGFEYKYLGNFTAIQPDSVIWRLRTLNDLIKARFGSLKERFAFGLVSKEVLPLIVSLLAKLQLWVIVASDRDKEAVHKALATIPADEIAFPLSIYSLDDIDQQLESLHGVM
jgi:hypothetical protein